MVLNSRGNLCELLGSTVDFVKIVVMCFDEIVVVKLDLDLV